MRRALPLLLWLAFGLSYGLADDFVVVNGGTLRPGLRLDSFRLATHPVTNADCKRFMDDTGYAPLSHWTGDRIPAGSEQHPVVFVNRDSDVRAYTEWRSRKEGRIYRLPTSSEFEYAARAGYLDAKFPWGTEPPTPQRANYSEPGERDLSLWRQRLPRVMSNNGKRLGHFNGRTFDQLPDPGPNEGDGRVLYAADLAGDFRDEPICTITENERRSVVIYTNTTPIQKRGVTRLADREYRTWLARNLCAGYAYLE